MFRDHKAWGGVVRNAAQGLCFFPVDNTIGRQDVVVKDVMTQVELVLDAADYIRAQYPLSWFKVLDEMGARNTPYLTLGEVEGLARAAGVHSPGGVAQLLKFLNQMGILMWHEEESLRQAVILDAVKFFVAPVTVVICKHAADQDDASVHELPIHDRCRTLFPRKWESMISRGVVDSQLLQLLLSEWQSHYDILVQLMIKFGFLVCLESCSGAEVSGKNSAPANPIRTYIVPALLPTSSPGDRISFQGIHPVHHVLFVCTTDRELCASACMSAGLTTMDLKSRGFLPRGLFERVMAKAISWYQTTCRTNELSTMTVTQDLVVLKYRNQRVYLTANYTLNCIEAQIEGVSPLAVYKRLEEQIMMSIDECMKSLLSFSAVSFTVFPDSDSGLALPLSSLQQWRTHTISPTLKNNNTLSHEEVQRMSEPWSPSAGFLPQYDVFISYRWGKTDSMTTLALFDAFAEYTIGARSRAVDVFLDARRLQDGQNFQEAFGEALIHSTIVVPVLSLDALQRMRTHDPNADDNLLIEWMLAMECLRSAVSRVKLITPL